MISEVQQACTQALRWLARREYFELEISRRLSGKGYSTAVVDETIQYLKQHNHLSEQRYAESFLRMRITKGDTPAMAARRACYKGVDAEVVEQELAICQEHHDGESACLNILNRRDPHGARFHDQAVRMRLARYLQNRGYETSLIFKSLDAQQDSTG